MTVEATDDRAEPFSSFYELPIWVEWKYARIVDPNTKKEDWRKIPYKPGSKFRVPSKETNPDTLGLVGDRDGDDYGIFLGYQSLRGVDIDGCRDSSSGVIDPWAMEWVQRFNSYTEVSPSGTGVKIFFLADGPTPLSKTLRLDGVKHKPPYSSAPDQTPKPPQIEVYYNHRYFTITGIGLAGTPGELRRCDEAWKEIIEFIARGNKARKAQRTTAVRSDHAGRDVALFSYGCRLRRQGLSDEVIEQMMLEKNTEDSDLHENFSTKGPLDDRIFHEKLRQVLKYESGDSGPNNELEEMNKEYTALSHEGGKFRIMTWKPSSTDAENREYVLMSKKDFEDSVVFPRVCYTIDTDKGPKDVAMPRGKWWLANPGRRQFSEMCFIPDGPPEIGRRLNIWQDFGFKASPGDWSLFRNHIKEVLASGNQEHDEYILRWMAWAVQNPGKPAKKALVFQGGQGTGKGTVGRTMARLFGTHGVQIMSSDHLTGRFNSLLHQCCLLFADEAFYAADRRGESKLKAFITEPTLTIERKGVDPVVIKNCLHIIMASNKDWIVPMDVDDRRFVVFRISDHHANDEEGYFDPMYKQLENGGYGGLLYDLREMALESWHPGVNPPDTEAKEEQKEYSDSGAHWRDLIERAITDALNRHGEPISGWKMLRGDMRKIISDDERVWRNNNNNSLFGRVMKDLGYKKEKVRYGQETNPKNCYVIGENPRAILEVTRDKDGVFIRVSPWDKELNPKGQNNARY